MSLSFNSNISIFLISKSYQPLSKLLHGIFHVLRHFCNSGPDASIRTKDCSNFLIPSFSEYPSPHLLLPFWLPVTLFKYLILKNMSFLTNLLDPFWNFISLLSFGPIRLRHHILGFFYQRKSSQYNTIPINCRTKNL